MSQNTSFTMPSVQSKTIMLCVNMQLKQSIKATAPKHKKNKTAEMAKTAVKDQFTL